MSFSGEGKLIEAVIDGDPDKTVVPVVCDASGHLIVDTSGMSVITGTVRIEDSSGLDLTSTSGALNVNVTDFPTTQPVSGTVTALQGTNSWVVSGAVTTSPNVNVHDGSGNSIGSTTGSLNVDVTNFPATQPVSGTVAVSNFPTTQPVSGAVSVSNFPSTYPVTGTFWQSTQPVSESNVDKNFGTWAYYAGTSGSVTVSGGQRVTAITCHCTTAGSLTIAGGATITVPANTTFFDNPLGNLTAPTIVFTGTDAYFIEVVS